MSQITFSLLPELEAPKLLHLFKSVYPNLSWSEKYFSWQYLENPAGRAVSFVAKRGDEILGNWTGVPFQMFMKGRISTGWRIQDVITRPEYSGLGIYFRLSMMGSKFIRNQNFSLNFAFPNERSFSGFIKNAWTAAVKIPLRVCEEIQLMPITILKAKVEVLNVFTEADEQIWGKYVQQVDFSLHRSLRYLNWRYFAKPDSDYSVFKLTLGSDQLILVLKYYKRENGERWSHICDMFQSGTNPELYEQGLRQAIQFSKQNECRALSVWWPRGNLDALFKKSRITLCSKINRWLVTNLNESNVNNADLKNEKRWHLVMGDSDVY